MQNSFPQLAYSHDQWPFSSALATAQMAPKHPKGLWCSVFGWSLNLRSPSESQEHLLISWALSLDQDIWQLTGPQQKCDLKPSSAAAIFSYWAVVRICLRQIPLLHSDGPSSFLCEESGNSIVIFQESWFSVFKSFELWRERENIIFLYYH